MRVPVTTVSLLLALCACMAPLRPFRPGDAAQAVPREPDAASATVAGVRVTVRPGSWSGWPYDLERRLTPVEVVIENGSGGPLDVRLQGFGLVGPDGSRHEPLEAQAVRRRFTPVPPSVAFYYGYYGVYPWPGFYEPWTSWYPYMWWGFRPGEINPPVPPHAYGPPLPARQEMAPEGTLEKGRRVSLLLFFAVPARSLRSLTFEAHLADPSGKPVGDVRLPFVRGDANPGVR